MIDFNGGSDGTRTRGLRRDRPEVSRHFVNKFNRRFDSCSGQQPLQGRDFDSDEAGVESEKRAAPGLKFGRHRRPYWIAKQVVRDPLGYPDKCVSLPVDADAETLASLCRRHTARLHAWIGHRRTGAPQFDRIGAVYFARSGDCIKIGFATCVNPRLQDLQVGNPEPITLLAIVQGTQDLERGLHRKFRALHVRGEWFRAAPSLLQYIELIAPDGGRETTPRYDQLVNRVDGPENFGAAR